MWFNVLNWDIYAWDWIFARNSISELDSDLLYIKENYNYSKEDLYSIISLLENKYNNFDSKKIYKNIILNDYKLARKLFDENIDTNNIFINKEKTISLLKNYYYSILSTTDYSQDAIVKTQFFRERRLCDTQLWINISAYVDCYALKTLRKNFIWSFIVDLYFGNNIWMIDQLDVLLDKTKSLLENISTDTEERKNINWIIKNIDSEILFEEWWEHIFNEIHDKFYDKDEKWNNLITEEWLKSLKEKMMNYRGEDKYDIDKVVIKPWYFRWDNIFEIEYEKEVYTISYWR